MLRCLVILGALSWAALPSDHVAPSSALIHGRVRGGNPARAVDRAPSMADPAGPRDPADRRRSVVYLESAPTLAFDELRAGHTRMDQRDEQFRPRVLAITVGTTVDFPNSDTTFHNVFSLSRTRAFDLGRYPAGRSKSVRFDRPGIVRVFCDIHSHMSAHILVFSHPYFAVTDDDGRYGIANVPPGSYTLMVWSELGRGDPRKIVVTEGASVEADFQLNRTP